ncbi:hypothetical protein ABL78_1347 [Leptomonas seymouri]|uniref:EF-hand domain-containing protein n=1 Tax=Leptomonas seymouri TaxID=5684 RepID=A0A0N0P859_LEPSE|nr:hypothetical protein ABL78_1347 [Leptomonas seymouri]|eukprot:KPI89579.1 hypothetical protein ABL78_1347 [Leptomonas seymouri]
MPPKGVGPAQTNFATMSSLISHDHVAELKEAFFVLDSSGSGTVSSAEVRHLLCYVIPNLGDAGFNRLLEQCRFDPDEPVTFAQFFVLLATASSNPEFGIIGDNGNALELYAAFAPFDPEDSGFVDASLFLYLMGEKGEMLSANELDELRQRLERTGFMKRGKVNYKGFINNLIATAADKKYT